MRLIILKGFNLFLLLIASSVLSGCEQVETSPSSQVEAANHLRNLGVSVNPDDNGVIWSLIIHQKEFRNEDCKYIRAFPNLKYLSLSETSVDDEGIKYLEGIISLEKIYLSKTSVTDDGLKSLIGMKILTILDLSETKVTDAAFETLKQIPSLEHLKIIKTSMTEEGIEKFKESNPTCEVQTEELPN